MPSPPADKAIRICIYGDSHLGCLKQALDQGLVDPRGYDIEFWGADGPYFRQLRLQDGVIRPDPEAEERVLLVNGRGRKFLRPGDFDVMFFMGARLRAGEFLEFLRRRMSRSNGFLSRAVVMRVARGWANRTRSYRYAGEIARSGAARVVYFPTPLPTFSGRDGATQPGPQEAGRCGDVVALGWSSLSEVAGSDGIDFIRQPDATVTGGLRTRAEFGCAGFAEAGDLVHKNARFGAIVLEQLFGVLEAAPVRAGAQHRRAAAAN